MDKKTLRLCLIWSACSFAGAIAIPWLWGLVAGGVLLSTNQWLFILLLAIALGFLSGAFLCLSIPRRIRHAIDNLTLQLGVRIESIGGKLGNDLGQLRLLLEQHLATKDAEAIASHESLMAEFVVVFLGMTIAETHLSAGQCKVCGGKHPRASELALGDPALYTYEAHGKLKDGKPCPIPYLYKLAQDRSIAQSRISK